MRERFQRGYSQGGNASASSADAEIGPERAGSVGPGTRAILLTGDSPAAVNSFEQPKNVVPVETAIADASNHFQHSFLAHSMTVIHVPFK